MTDEKTMDVFKLAPDRRQELEKLKSDFHDNDHKTLVDGLRNLKDMKIQMEDNLKEINLQMEALTEVFHEIFEKEEMDVLSFVGIGRVTVGFDVYPQVVSKELVMKWLKGNEGKELIREDFSWQSLKSFVKEMIDKAEPLPDEDVIHVFMKPKVNFRRK